ncbi:hypothetical protein [Georgenia alba]|uniref:Uncharacterized protein n=1 Tax=Georgenia alba TaxID=2233858 RepID=A0ABW2Q7N5_9MICO
MEHVDEGLRARVSHPLARAGFWLVLIVALLGGLWLLGFAFGS